MKIHSQQDILISLIKQNSLPIEPISAHIKPQLTRIPHIKVVIFDVYGTMFISASGDIGTVAPEKDDSALVAALRQSGFELIRQQAGSVGIERIIQQIKAVHTRLKKKGIEYPEVNITRVFKYVLKLLQKEGFIKGRLSKSIIEKVCVEYETRKNNVWPIPCLKQVLSELEASKKILGIVSNAQFYTPLLFPAFLQKSTRALGFKKQLLLWSYQYLRAKPSLFLFNRLRSILKRRYNIVPGQAVYLGNDMLNDIMPAARAGFKTILFAGDKRSLRLRTDDARCKDVVADCVITSLEQIFDII